MYASCLHLVEAIFFEDIPTANLYLQKVSFNNVLLIFRSHFKVGILIQFLFLKPFSMQMFVQGRH